MVFIFKKYVIAQITNLFVRQWEFPMNGFPNVMSLLSTNMSEGTDAGVKTNKKFEFNERNSNEIQKLLDGKDKKNTQKSTKSALKQLREYLLMKNEPDIHDLPAERLPQILFNFYASVKPKTGQRYATQSLKCIRAALNRWFKAEKCIDIIKDPGYVRTNEIFKGVLVDARRNGKVKKATPKISNIDLERIGEYFQHD